MGCCGDRELAAERKLPAAKNASLDAVQRKAERNGTTMVISAVDTEDFVGVATGRNYGRVRRGDVFSVDTKDFTNDKRLARLTQDTLRLFS